MSRGERAVFTNMCMIYDGSKVLVQDRADTGWKGLSFPGGHVEDGESFVDSVIREVKEETSLIISDIRLCGVKQFMTRDQERYVVFLYKTAAFSGSLTSSSEGEMLWVEIDDLLSRDDAQLTPDFKELLKLFIDDTYSECYYEKHDSVWELVLK